MKPLDLLTRSQRRGPLFIAARELEMDTADLWIARGRCRGRLFGRSSPIID